MSWKMAAGVTIGLFGAGIVVGYEAQRRGIPQDQIGRWLVKGVTRRALWLIDAAKEALPDEPPERLKDAIAGPSPRPVAST